MSSSSTESHPASETAVVEFMASGQKLTIAYTIGAEWRMGTLDRPFVLADFHVKRRAYACLIAWIWACLQGKSSALYSSPEDVAAIIRKDEDVAAAFEAFIRAYKLANEQAEKNGRG